MHPVSAPRKATGNQGGRYSQLTLKRRGRPPYDRSFRYLAGPVTLVPIRTTKQSFPTESVHAPSAQPPSRFTVSGSGPAHGGDRLPFGPRPRFHPDIHHFPRAEQHSIETSAPLTRPVKRYTIWRPRAEYTDPARRLPLREENSTKELSPPVLTERTVPSPDRGTRATGESGPSALTLGRASGMPRSKTLYHNALEPAQTSHAERSLDCHCGAFTHCLPCGTGLSWSELRLSAVPIQTQTSPSHYKRRRVT